MNRLIALLAVLVIAASGCKKDSTLPTDGEEVLQNLGVSPSALTVNPYGNAPLSALLNYKTLVPGHTKIVVKGQDGDASDITEEFADGGLSHSIPIAGLYPSYDNIINIYFIDSALNKETAMSTLTVHTGALPTNMPNYMHVDIADYSNMEPGLNLVSNFSQYTTPPQMPYMMDAYGKIRWYLDFTNNADLKGLYYDCGIARLQNGNFYFADLVSGHIYEVDVLGKIVNKWGFPGYTFHHNVTEKPDGNFLVSVTKTGSTNINGLATIEDYIIEIDRTTGSITNTWDLKESLNELRSTLTSNLSDWMHVNAVIYDATDNTIIVSGRTQGVVKLTYANKVKWILAPHKGWTTNRNGDDLNKYLLTPLDDDNNPITAETYLDGYTNNASFEWNWYQHSPVLLPNHHLILFDNGDIRNYDSTQPQYSRAVEFNIDESAMTVKQVWQYGKERGLETFSRVVSSVKYLPTTNHILFSPGYQVLNAVGQGGKMVEIDYATKKVVFQASVSSADLWGWHRVDRMALYGNNKSY